ncbi:hypothetical protein LCGC14_0384370 [marine sediment metagenome]|uniref:Uncharacterized protein n=1 Tax=marine sediment metagenome TaxID=412755 RepID=A0A0F9WAA6_9ZZZZ
MRRIVPIFIILFLFIDVAGADHRAVIARKNVASVPVPDWETDWNGVGADDETCAVAGGCSTQGAATDDQWQTLANDANISVSSDIFVHATASGTGNVAEFDNFDGQTEFTLQFDFRIIDNSGGWGNTKLYTMAQANAFMSMKLQTGGASGTFDFLVTRVEADAAGADNTYGITFTSNQWYTVTVYAKQDTDGGADVGGDDGIVQSWIDSTSAHTETDVDNDTKVIDSYRLGGITNNSDNNSNIEFDNWRYWNSDQRTALGF